MKILIIILIAAFAYDGISNHLEEKAIVVAPVATTIIHRNSDGLFYIDATVNGQSVHFLIDTGATHVVLNNRDARAIGFHPIKYDENIVTAAGKPTMAWKNIDVIDIGGKSIRDVRAAVISSELPVSLLGQNMLSRMGSVKIEGDDLIIT